MTLWSVCLSSHSSLFNIFPITPNPLAQVPLVAVTTVCVSVAVEAVCLSDGRGRLGPKQFVVVRRWEVGGRWTEAVGVAVSHAVGYGQPIPYVVYMVAVASRLLRFDLCLGCDVLVPILVAVIQSVKNDVMVWIGEGVGIGRGGRRPVYFQRIFRIIKPSLLLFGQRIHIPYSSIVITVPILV